MSFAPTNIRGARLKARFAVNGIHSSSSDGRAAVEGEAGALSVSVAMASVVGVGPRRASARSSPHRYVQYGGRSPNGRGHWRMSENAGDLEEVQRRLADIQRRKRGRIQWRIGKH